MKIISFMVEKGGTGKTTGAREVAGILQRDKKVLLIDLDFQRNLSTSLNFESSRNIYDAIMKRDFKGNIVKITDNLDLIPGDLRMRNLDDDLKVSITSDFVIKEQLSVINHYDYVIIDCRPDMKKPETNAINASDIVLTPIEPHSFSLDGFDILESFIGTHKSTLKPNLIHKGYLSRVPNDKKFLEGIGELLIDYREDMLVSFIRENIKLKEAEMCGQFIFEYSPRSNGTTDFENLTREILRYGK